MDFGAKPARLRAQEREHRYSFTQIDMYIKCPRQYQYRYIEHIKDPPGIALIEGSCHHEGFHHNNELKIKSGKDGAPKEQYEVFMDKFNREKLGVADWAGDDEKGVTDRARKIIEVYHKTFAPRLVPVKAETEYKCDIAGYPFIAYVDVETEKNVWDYKVASKKLSEGEVETHLQLSLYAIITGKWNVGLIQVLKQTMPKVEPVAVLRTIGHKRWAVSVVDSNIKAIQAGVFPMTNPSYWWCSERFCGYYHRCKETRVKGKNLPTAVAPKPEADGEPAAG